MSRLDVPTMSRGFTVMTHAFFAWSNMSDAASWMPLSVVPLSGLPCAALPLRMSR